MEEYEERDDSDTCGGFTESEIMMAVTILESVRKSEVFIAIKGRKFRYQWLREQIRQANSTVEEL
jgi:hypothetical protein